MLRALVVALLLANLLFFAWTRGWLAPLAPPPAHGEREPERLAMQVRPDGVRFFPTPAAASAAAAAATLACLESGPYGDDEVGGAETALVDAGIGSGTWTRRSVQRPVEWLVYVGRFASAGALRARADELRQLKLSFDELRAPPELAPGLVLSRHDGRDAADAALAPLVQAGLRGARVVALPPAPPQHWLRVERADAALRERLREFRPPAGAAAFAPCRG